MSYRAPAAVLNLLSGPLDTFEKLEVAMGLARAPAQTSSVGELVVAVGMPRDQIERGGEGLQTHGWVNAAGGLLRLVVPTPDAPAFAALMALYDEDRALIAQAVAEVAMEKIRGMTARAFAEAFAATRKKSGDGHDE